MLQHVEAYAMEAEGYGVQLHIKAYQVLLTRQ